MVATLTIFFIFNVKEMCGGIKWMSMLFMVPAIGGFVPLFINGVSIPVNIGFD
jgi:hypothetical protein